ncbi:MULTISPECIES: class IIb bacteriocin, lactobin A/cerein 7B family [Clostridium]|uniref:Class IIb bacteriocin, lactobin A/cerein 7B family n=1 Tax=Clostridium frigoriphilum TaxID=443253 RepID=A0ABU7URB2_9CLOT|nr:class IIb bacteriocin, lactobin A/cerein 7B family [Clostridium sp. DSM 17811]MBU3100836.1 class IIb bacteriocin, lactobin A/cerein 7B family [Clostridium sp. DSM 17811]
MNNLIELNESDLSEINGGIWSWLVAVGAAKATPYVVAGTIFVGGVVVGFINGKK